MSDRWLARICIGLSVGTVFFGVLFLGRQLAYRDTASFYYPLYEAVQAEWNAGRIPFWNPYESSGTPLLANPTAAVFYPGKLIFFLPWSYGSCFRLYVVGHVVLCALAAYRMARGWGCSRRAGTVCAIAYGLSGFVLAQCSNVVFLVGAAWVPLALLYGERVVRRPSPSAACRLGVVLALQVLGGDPEAAYLCGLLVLGYALARSVRRAAPRFRPVLALAAAAAIALLLSLIQVLPTLELVAASERASDELPRSEETYRYSAGPWTWLELVAPGVTGQRYPVNRNWTRIWPAAHDVWTPTLYMGLVPLVLAVSALRRRGMPPQPTWLALVALFGLVGALGRYGGLYGVMHGLLPGFAAFRYPAKLLVFAAIGIAGLAAFGWDRWVAAHTRLPPRILWSVAAAGALALVVSVTTSRHIESWLDRGADAARDAYYGPLDVRGARADIQRALLHITLAALAAAALSMRGIRVSGSRRASATLVVLVAVDVVVANAWVVQTAPQADFDTTPHVLQVLREHQARDGDAEPFRIYRPAVMYPIAWGTRSSADRIREILRWSRDSLKPKFGLRYAIEDMAVRGTLDLRDYHHFYTGWPEPTDPRARSRTPQLPPLTIHHSPLAFDAWNVKYFVVPHVLTPPMVADPHRGTQSFLADRSGRPAPVLYRPPRESAASIDYQVLLNPDRYPRAWIVHEVERLRPFDRLPPDERLRLVRSLTVEQRYDLRRTALIEAEDPAEAPAPAVPGVAATPSSARIVRHDPDRVEVETTAAAAGVLVLADAFYPGWEARIDGHPVPIRRANLMMRAVEVPAGVHTVSLRYRFAGFPWIALLSGCTWSTLGAGWLLRHRRSA